MSLSGADPHGLTEHEAASIHVYTQETRFYHTLNEHLRGTDRSKVEPYKPCVCAMPFAPSAPLTYPPHSFLKLLLTALHKIPASTKTLYRGVAKALSQLSQKFETGKPVVWWPVTSTASHVNVLENPMFMGKSGSRCLFTITSVSARDIQRYSALGSKEREFVLIPGSCFVVEAILDAGSGLTIVQMAEDSSMKLLKFTPSTASPSPSAPLPPAVPSTTHGKKTYSNGDYEGEMKDEKRNGRGKHTWPSGDVYEGEWKDDKINGRGKYTWPECEFYEGEFKDGKSDGKGKHNYANGQVYEGEFQDDKRNGRGKMTYPSGQVYEGEYKDGNKNGRGKQTYPCGQVYEGEWKDGKMNERGKMTWPSGQCYEGEFKDGDYHGQGTMTYANGRRESGRWCNDKFMG
jgi:hypothetical protein